jgi:hypothetical protein
MLWSVTHSSWNTTSVSNVVFNLNLSALVTILTNALTKLWEKNFRTQKNQVFTQKNHIRAGLKPLLDFGHTNNNNWTHDGCI